MWQLKIGIFLKTMRILIKIVNSNFFSIVENFTKTRPVQVRAQSGQLDVSVVVVGRK
jgi:hypothetical protein